VRRTCAASSSGTSASPLWQRLLTRSRGVGGVAWSELAAADWILPPERTVVRQALAYTLAQAGLLMPRPVVESAQLSTDIELAAAGVGVALAPVAAVAVSERRGAVRRIAVEPLVTVPPLAVLVRVAHEEVQAIEPLIAAMRAFDR